MQKITAFFIGIGLFFTSVIGIILAICKRDSDDNASGTQSNIDSVGKSIDINNDIGNGINNATKTVDRAKDDAGDAKRAIDTAQGIVDAIKKRAITDDKEP